MSEQKSTPKELLAKLNEITKEAGYGKILNISLQLGNMEVITICNVNYFNHCL